MCMEMENAQQEVKQEGSLNQNSPPANPALNQRGNFLLIIGIVVLLVVGAGGYFLYQKQVNKPTVTPQQSSYPTPSPTPDETLNWKSIKGNGWEFKYPPEFILTDKSNNGLQIIELEGGNNFGIKEKFRLIIESMEKNIPLPKSDFMQTQKYNGVDWHLYSGYNKCTDIECDVNTRTFVTTNANQAYSFVMLRGRNRSAINSILDTFRMTK